MTETNSHILIYHALKHNLIKYLQSSVLSASDIFINSNYIKYQEWKLFLK